MENLEKYAELFAMICNNFDGGSIGKKVSQKLFYFFERMGIELNLRYCIHFYGPYSSRLDNMMHILESEDYISINDDMSTHIISLSNSTLEESTLDESEKEIAEKVIELFGHKTPLELEALATMDYVFNTILNKEADDEKIISTFKDIKGTKFNDTIISNTISELKRISLIAW